MGSAIRYTNSNPNLTAMVRLVCALLVLSPTLHTQQPTPAPPQLPDAPSTSVLSGTVTDAQDATVSNANISLEKTDDKTFRSAQSDGNGVFSFKTVTPGIYLVRITAPGFASWKIEDVIIRYGEDLVLPPIILGVESIKSTVDAITQEDLAEQQISAEVKQRIIGVLPNFYVSYIPNAAPLTRKQKFKLAIKTTVDPVTFFTTGVTAGIEQWQGDFEGYGQGFGGYAKRYGATYGDRVTSTFFGAALLPSLLHQDPRYFYKGKGKIINRALYAISTVVICKGDNGHWQPNYSNILGNLAAGGVSSLYYPNSEKHDAQVTVDNIFIGIGTGAIGTLFQEFLLRHLTHGVPAAPPVQAPAPTSPKPATTQLLP
ncbi:MAG: carboxypeptidase-like regulatory domain-containing protein [Edaphobacter sp.]